MAYKDVRKYDALMARAMDRGVHSWEATRKLVEDALGVHFVRACVDAVVGDAPESDYAREVLELVRPRAAFESALRALEGGCNAERWGVVLVSTMISRDADDVFAVYRRVADEPRFALARALVQMVASRWLDDEFEIVVLDELRRDRSESIQALVQNIRPDDSV